MANASYSVASGGITDNSVYTAALQNLAVSTGKLADQAVTLPKLVHAGAQFDFLMRNSSGSGAWEDATLAQVKAALGYSDALINTQFYPSTAAFSDSTGSYADITGVTFTPTAGGIYLCDYFAIAYTAATTTGFGIQINVSNEQYGAAFMYARGGTQSSQGLVNNAFSSNVIAFVGTTAPASPARVPCMGWFIFKAHATTPGACKLQATTEVGGSQIDIAAGDIVMRARRLV